jgi:hypothetical protein
MSQSPASNARLNKLAPIKQSFHICHHQFISYQHASKTIHPTRNIFGMRNRNDYSIQLLGGLSPGYPDTLVLTRELRLILYGRQRHECRIVASHIVVDSMPFKLPLHRAKPITKQFLVNSLLIVSDTPVNVTHAWILMLTD